jgi:ferredoxin
MIRPLLALAAVLLSAPAALAQNPAEPAGQPPREAVAGCMARATRAPAGYSGEVLVKVGVDAAGNPTRMDMVKGQAPEELVDAIAEAVQLCKWIAGTDAAGKPAAGTALVPVRVEDAVREAARADPGPKLPVPHSPADEGNPGCVARMIQLPPSLRTTVIAHFTVTPEGKAEALELTGERITPELRQAFADAIPSCPWKPGRDAEGRPVASRYSMRFTISERASFDEEARDPRLVKDPRAASERCVQWAIDRDPFDPKHRNVYVRFRVTVDGTPEKFSIKPDGVDARSRTLLIDAFSSCRWVPGEDKDGKPVAAWITWPLVFRNSSGAPR